MARWTEPEIAQMLQAQRTLPVPTVDGLSPRERWPELHQLFAGYLHQDFDLDGTAEECVRIGVADLSAAKREATSAQLRQLRARGLTENEVARALWDLGMEYVPYADDWTAVEWVDWITATVDEARERPPG